MAVATPSAYAAAGRLLRLAELTRRRMSRVTDRQPEPWETNEARPFLTLERPSGTVAISALGDDRFRVQAPEREQVVVGFGAAHERAHALASELD